MLWLKAILITQPMEDTMGDLKRLGYRVEVNMNMGEGVDMCALHYNIEVDK